MGFFNSNKDDEESLQAHEIKQASTPSASNETNQTQSQDKMQDQNNSENNYVNPFSQAQNQEQTQDNSYYPDNNLQTQTPNSNPQFPDVSPVPATPNQNQSMNMNMNQGFGQDFQNSQQLNEEKVQDIVYETFEKLLEDKWNSITSNVEGVVNWKEEQEQEFENIKKNIAALKEGMEIIEKKIMSKIENYDKNILDVNSEIRALEKVFQKITPTLINNVNELSKITQDLKEIKKNNTKETSEDNKTIQY